MLSPSPARSQATARGRRGRRAPRGIARLGRWEYIDAHGARAPIEGRDLLAGIASGRLSAATLVRRAGRRRWREAGLTGAFDTALYPPTAFGALPEYDAPDQAVRARTYPRARPWVRLWARLVDLALFGALVRYLVEVALWRPQAAGELAIGLATVMGWLVIEAVALAAVGTTPGKALLKVKVRRRDGRLLDFPGSLNRAFDVWLKGLGMGLPVVVIVTELLAYRRLTRTGVTSWDESGDVLVSHGRIGPARIALAAALLLAALALRAA